MKPMESCPHGCVPMCVTCAFEEVERLRARKAMVCETCVGGTQARKGWRDACPDCGKDGCGPGVRWAT